MKYKVHGLRFSKGEFTDKESGELVQYSNVVFYCTHPSVNEYTIGSNIAEVKIKRSLISESDHELKQIIGKEVLFDIMVKGDGKAVYTGLQILNK